MNSKNVKNDTNEHDELVDRVADDFNLALVAKRLIDLEKDLLFPGSAVSDSVRRQRIMEQIEKENF
jgi:hypothetical protein